MAVPPATSTVDGAAVDAMRPVVVEREQEVDGAVLRERLEKAVAAATPAPAALDSTFPEEEASVEAAPLSNGSNSLKYEKN